jgi:hypothetical protein
MNILKITSEQTIELIQSFVNKSDHSLSLEADSKKHAFVGYQHFEKIFELKLPLPFPKISNDEEIENYLNQITYPIQSYLIILIQSGYCALGFFKDNEIARHVALRTYMTRKKQGKNQLTYLNSGKKSGTSGGQLRYQNAIHFFEEINKKLNEWNEINSAEKILYSCPIKMLQHLFQSKVKCPFDKKDSRLHKIPFDVNVPNFEEMMRINKLISLGYLTFYKQIFEDSNNFFDNFLSVDRQ